MQRVCALYAHADVVCRVYLPAGVVDVRRSGMATFALTMKQDSVNLPGVDPSGKPSLKRALGVSGAHTDLVRQVAPVTVRCANCSELALSLPAPCSVVHREAFSRQCAGIRGCGAIAQTARACLRARPRVADPEEVTAEESERPGAAA